MTIVLSRDAPIIVLFHATVTSVEAYKIAAVSAISASVDVLGPGGRLAMDTYGAFIMPVAIGIVLLWATAATAFARVMMERE